MSPDYNCCAPLIELHRPAAGISISASRFQPRSDKLFELPGLKGIVIAGWIVTIPAFGTLESKNEQNHPDCG
jgi:hypothetical protein